MQRVRKVSLRIMNNLYFRGNVHSDVTRENFMRGARQMCRASGSESIKVLDQRTLYKNMLFAINTSCAATNNI